MRPRASAAARVWIALALCAAAFAREARAHDARPAYLQIDESAPGRYALLWRTPVFSGTPLPVALALPVGARDVREPIAQTLSDSLVLRRWIEADGGLAGARIGFPGLEATITDVLVRVSFSDGTRSVTLVRPSRPYVELRGAMGRLEVARAYLLHGIEHIAFGYDHLLFVLALILIVRSTRALLFTITAFTLAHSLTLALATLGLVHVPGPPVEAAIALSILLLAVEVVRLQRGEVGLSARWPWVVAFAFGLLHGFGFASALRDLGLPQADVPLALLAFNLGVELGQLAFVALVFALVALARRAGVGTRVARTAPRVAPYVIGSLGAFWFFERLASF